MKHILALRKLVIQLQQISIGEQTNEQKSWLQDLALHYKLNTDLTESNFFELLLKRVDVIPPSLALAQAAIESGWGTSRFSKQGNNLFGQWCFSRGCGMVPASRDSGRAHEVAKFTTVNLAIRAYIINLNTNAAYTGLRKKRASLRQEDQQITGLLLAEKLNKYSEEGDLYVKKLVQFINQNKLQRFTDKFNDSLIPKQEESKV